MKIYVPNYIIVRTSSTAGDNSDDPQMFLNQIQATIQDIQRSQEEQADEFKLLKLSVDQIRDLLIQANAIRNPNAPARNEDDGNMPGLQSKGGLLPRRQ
jgi:hypothetical protein